MRAVAYARFSSDNQREESIDAQIRAIREYCERERIDLIDAYVDEAKTATSDRRPAFQQMVADSAVGKFDAVIVHKLDRFARDRYDSAFYRRQLKKNGCVLLSVLERLDGSPESVILESMLEGMAEYYSKNLAREVAKGQRENALKCIHNGGIPPLGYDVLPDKTYKVNEYEADTVRLIFGLYADGKTYGDILKALEGRRTKTGGTFGKNSLHDLLRNEKYIGTYVFGRSAASVDGKRNNHANKPDEDIIKIQNGMPRIISDEVWQRVQERMNAAEHNGAYKAKTVYLLSGKLVCGKCGSLFIGRTTHPKGKTYSDYVCGLRERKHECDMKKVSKAEAEEAVISVIEQMYSVDADAVAYELELALADQGEPAEVARAKERYAEIEKREKQIVKAVLDGLPATMFVEESRGYEAEKAGLLKAMQYKKKIPTHSELVEFVKRTADIRLQTDEEKKRTINNLIDKVIVYDDDRIEVHFKVKNGQKDVIDTDGKHLSPPFEIIIVIRYGKIARRNRS